MSNGHARDNWFIDLLKRNTITLVLLAFSVVMAALNSYAALQLVPITTSVNSLTQRVSAIENDRSPLKERFFKLEEKVDVIDKRTDRMDSKLDRLLIK